MGLANRIKAAYKVLKGDARAITVSATLIHADGTREEFPNLGVAGMTIETSAGSPTEETKE